MIPIRYFLNTLTVSTVEVTGSYIQQKLIHCLLTTVLINLKSAQSKQKKKNFHHFEVFQSIW